MYYLQYVGLLCKLLRADLVLAPGGERHALLMVHGRCNGRSEAAGPARVRRVPRMHARDSKSCILSICKKLRKLTVVLPTLVLCTVL